VKVSGAETGLALLAAALLAGLLAVRIGAPWTFIHDDNGAWTQAVATAHLEAGLARTRGQDFYLRRSDGALVPYLHHPPLYPLVTAGAYALAGRSDPWVTRLVPALFHLLGFVGLAALARQLFPESRGRRAIALLLYAVVPMSTFFGKLAFNEPLGLCAVIWATLFLARHRARGSPADLAASAAGWAVAGFTSWPAFAILFAFFLLSVAEALRGTRPGARREAWALGVAGLATFALVLGQLWWAAGGAVPPVLAAGQTWGVHRTTARTLAGSLGRAFDFHRLYFANVPFALFLAWCVAALLGRSAPGPAWPEATRVLLAGAAGCALWALLFVKQVAIHAYGQFWFLPFEVLAVADLTVRLWSHARGRPALRAAVAAGCVIVTLASSTWLLVRRYTEVHPYAVRTARQMAQWYHMGR
jgi:hypothetical protein